MADIQEQAKAIKDGFQITIQNRFINKQIIGFDKIFEYFNSEQQKWGTVGNKNGINMFHILNSLVNLCNQLNTVEDNIDVFNDKFQNIRGQINQLVRNEDLFWTETKEGSLIYSLAQKGSSKDEISGAISYVKNEQFSHFDRDSFNGFAKAYEFYHNDDSTIVKRSASEEKSLFDLREEWKAKTAKLNEELQKMISERDKIESDFKKRSDDLITAKEKEFSEKIRITTEMSTSKEKELTASLEEGKKQISANDDLYKTKLRLEAAVQYWHKRTSSYRKRGYWWLAALVSCTAILSGGLIIILYNLPLILQGKTGLAFDPISIKVSLILLTAISVGAYLIRIFSKLTFSSFHLARDSEEREQLTHVYLALKEKHAVAENNESVILQALFSRADTGMLGGDHSPTMPTMVEKIMSSPK